MVWWTTDHEDERRKNSQRQKGNACDHQGEQLTLGSTIDSKILPGESEHHSTLKGRMLHWVTYLENSWAGLREPTLHSSLCIEYVHKAGRGTIRNNCQHWLGMDFLEIWSTPQPLEAALWRFLTHLTPIKLVKTCVILLRCGLTFSIWSIFSPASLGLWGCKGGNQWEQCQWSNFK